MENLKCPYCGATLEVCHDDGHGTEEDVTYEQECKYCGKTFVFTVSISFDYKAEQAPCKNGGEHDWRPRCGFPEEYFKGHERCHVCDEERVVKV